MLPREEWCWLKSLGGGDVAQRAEEAEPDALPPDKAPPDDTQLQFQRAISKAARSLFAQLDVPQELYDVHRQALHYFPSDPS